MKNLFIVIIVLIMIGLSATLLKGVFDKETELLVPDSWTEVNLIKVIDSNTYKVQDTETGDTKIVKSILTDNDENSKVFIDTTLKAATNIYIEEDGNHVDTYNNPEVWVWYFDINGEKHLLQEELSKKNLVSVYKSYATDLLYEDEVMNA